MTSNCDQSVEIYPIFTNFVEVVWVTTAAMGPCPILERLFRIASGASVCS